MKVSIGREAKFLKLLKKRPVSRKQAIAWFNLKNPSAAIIRFQDSGEKITRVYTYSKQKRYTSVTYSV